MSSKQGGVQGAPAWVDAHRLHIGEIIRWGDGVFAVRDEFRHAAGSEHSRGEKKAVELSDCGA